MLQARGLTKRYGGLLALDRVSFDLQPGEIVGYLGPNGSGKSTTVNLVVGLLEPSAGAISLVGIRASDDPIAYKRRIGYVPEEPSLYAHLTAAEYLMLVGRLRRLPSRTLQTPRPRAAPAVPAARQPLQDDDGVLEGHAAARPGRVRAAAQPASARARRAVLRPRRQRRPAAPHAPAHARRARAG